MDENDLAILIAKAIKDDREQHSVKTKIRKSLHKLFESWVAIFIGVIIGVLCTLPFVTGEMVTLSRLLSPLTTLIFQSSDQSSYGKILPKQIQATMPPNEQQRALLRIAILNTIQEIQQDKVATASQAITLLRVKAGLVLLRKEWQATAKLLEQYLSDSANANEVAERLSLIEI